MLTIKNRNQEAIGQLENAFNIGNYERRANQLSSFSFSLPKNDPKNELCNHFNYVDLTGDSGRYYGLFRIMPKNTVKDENNDSITYSCDHVISTLLGDVIKGHLPPLINRTTRENIERILSFQETQNWVLGECEFERYFQYSFSNENGLLAPILSIPQPFDEPYIFTYDTTSYPWKLNLLKADDIPKWDMVWTRDLKSFDENVDPSEIVNRIYPLGYGEGVNQLGIEDVNNGVDYLEDTDSINEWGLHQYVWVDRRIEDAETLKANAQSLLNQWKQPKISIQAKSVDLSIKEEFQHLQRPFYTVGDIVIEDKTYQARIIGEKIPDLSKEYEVDYEIENKLDDIAETQANLERKQQVNDAYSQGATNHDSVTLSENCDSDYPLRFRIWIPEDAININTMILTYESTKFRGYTRGSEDGGFYQKSSVVKSESTEGGGSFTQPSTVVSETSSSGGGQTTSSGGGQTSSGNGDHGHTMMTDIGSSASAPSSWKLVEVRDGVGGFQVMPVPSSWPGSIATYSRPGDHTHTVSNHTHSVSNHTHTVNVTIPGITIDEHTHNFTVEIPAINIPNHSHAQIYGIYESNETPSALTITVDGNPLPTNSTSAENVDLVPYLQKDSSGKITRNRWATIEISPDTLARINATVVTRLFIQSRLGGKY